jgi:hypothetical protein
MRKFLPVAFLSLAVLGVAQTPQSGGTLAVAGRPGKTPVIQIDGRSYVEVEALARLVEGSVSFKANQITLTVPASTPDAAEPKPKPGFSPGFLKAGIEQMTVIREWRIAIVNAIQNGYPLSGEWVESYRLTAESKLALAGAAALTDSDRSGLVLLTNENANMQKWSASYLEMQKNLTHISPDSLQNDSLNQQILTCAQGLAALAADGRYQDVASCH